VVTLIPPARDHCCEVRLLHGQDPGFECGDLLQDLGHPTEAMALDECSTIIGTWRRPDQSWLSLER